MKDKIFKLLKDGAGKTSVNDRTLEAYAVLIAGKITDESQLDSEIKTYLGFIKEMDGNINSVAKQAAADKEADLKSKYVPPKEKEEQTEDKKYLTIDEINKLLADQKIEADKVKSFERMLGDAKSMLAEKGLKPKLLNKLFANIQQTEGLTAESIMSSIQKEYDEIYSDVVPETGKPTMSTLSNGSQVPSGIADFLKSKQDQIKASTEKKELV